MHSHRRDREVAMKPPNNATFYRLFRQPHRSLGFCLPPNLVIKFVKAILLRVKNMAHPLDKHFDASEGRGEETTGCRITH